MGIHHPINKNDLIHSREALADCLETLSRLRYQAGNGAKSMEMTGKMHLSSRA